MTTPVAQTVLDQAFVQARTFNKFTSKAVDDATIAQLYDLLKWGPTSMNSQPGRYVFVRSEAAKQRLKPALSPGNIDKTMASPLTVIVAYHTSFHHELPTQFPAMPNARDMFDGSDTLVQSTAFRNSSMQGAYLMIAARMLGLDVGAMSGFDAGKVNAEFFPDGSCQANFLVNLGYGDPSGNYPRGPRLTFDQAVTVV